MLGTRRPGTGVCRALRARSVSGVSPRMSPGRGCPRKTGGVRGSVRRGVCGALRAPGSGVSEKCPDSVLGVSKRCPGHSGDTLGTLFGHSGARCPDGSRRHPPFSGTLPRRHSRGHFGPEGARETPVPGQRVIKFSEGKRTAWARCRQTP